MMIMKPAFCTLLQQQQQQQLTLHSFFTRKQIFFAGKESHRSTSMIPVCRNVFNLHRYLLPKTTKRMLTTTKQDGIFYITLNRPEKQNAVNLETASLLFDAFKKFNACQDTSVGILHGNGGNFCAGFDLEELSSLDEQDVSELQEWNYEKKAPMVLC